jgi:hypothetical protein
MKTSEILEILACVRRLIFLLLEIMNARRKNDGHSDTA